jgi:TM2 domain-containing membrane protein YozV
MLKGGNGMKSKVVALILSIFLGELVIDRFYLGYIGTGILKLITCGGFGIWWLIDLIMIATGKLKPKDGSEYAE